LFLKAQEAIGKVQKELLKNFGAIEKAIEGKRKPLKICQDFIVLLANIDQPAACEMLKHLHAIEPKAVKLPVLSIILSMIRKNSSLDTALNMYSMWIKDQLLLFLDDKEVAHNQTYILFKLLEDVQKNQKINNPIHSELLIDLNKTLQNSKLKTY